MRTNKGQKTSGDIEQKKTRKRENSLTEENNSFQNDKTKERLKKSENKESMSKVKKSRSPKNEPDNHAKIPEPTITANKLSYEPNFNEKYFSEELGLNNQTQLFKSDSENRYSEEKNSRRHWRQWDFT